MYCKNCGAQIPDDSKFCVKCGTNMVETESENGGELPSQKEASTSPIKKKEDTDNAKKSSDFLKNPKKLRILIAVMACVIVLCLVFVVIHIVNTHNEENISSSYTSSTNSDFSVSSSSSESNISISNFFDGGSFDVSHPNDDENLKLLEKYLMAIGKNYKAKYVGQANDSGLTDTNLVITYETDGDKIHYLLDGYAVFIGPVKEEHYISGNTGYTYDKNSGTWITKDLSDSVSVSGFITGGDDSWTIESISESNRGYIIKGIVRMPSLAPGDFEYTFDIQNDKPSSLSYHYKNGFFQLGKTGDITFFISEMQIYDIGTTSISLPDM